MSSGGKRWWDDARMQPEAVVFDIGNVLTSWQPEAFYDRVIGPDRRARLFAEVDLHHMNALVDDGALFRETIYDWADRHAAWAPRNPDVV